MTEEQNRDLSKMISNTTKQLKEMNAQGQNNGTSEQVTGSNEGNVTN